MNYVEEIHVKLSKKLPKVPFELLKLYSLLVLTTGEKTSWGNVHDAWSIWANSVDRNHVSIIEFELLSPTVQDMDEKYAIAIQEVAQEINNKKR